MITIVSLDNRCKLVYKKNITGRLGITEDIFEEKEVFCGVRSVTGKEFAEMGKSGIRPELSVIVRREVYDNAVGVIYNNKKYSIYRTYNNSKDFTELYLCIKEGVEYGIGKDI